ncbi:undecaprenyl-diphosphatase [Hoeflea marina]|uniref:Undecaprenyl-diphosphatase n=1 Tax=Hoeflea marina TaxID=274592 RepID=A0A317PRR5_9HYPH|nr:phosphatase PAP2 family protein [Hoeflea marina]PWW02270.1 undecaprenyl-diphosphatase [Hoeflea marina]
MNPIKTARANIALAFRRGARRREAPFIKPLLVWEMLLAAFVGALIAASLLDSAIGETRGTYPVLVSSVSQWVTRLGKSDWILIPTGVALIALTFVNVETLTRKAKARLFRWNVLLCFIFIGVGLPSLVSTLLKRVIGRPRPTHFAESGLFDFQPFTVDASFASFPSGHSTTIGALAMVLVLLIPRFRHLFIVVGALVGASRIGVGAHYPSDVLVGLLLGAGGAYLVAKWFAAHGLLFLDTPMDRPAVRPAMRLRHFFE